MAYRPKIVRAHPFTSLLAVATVAMVALLASRCGVRSRGR